MYQLTVAPEAAPDEPEYVEIDFEQGVPKRVNGVAMGPIDLAGDAQRASARGTASAASTWWRTGWSA